jgi:hypothetical protein
MARVPAPKYSLNVVAAEIVLGGVLLSIGALLPWMTVASADRSASLSGLDGGDGFFFLLFGAVVALLALTRLVRPGLPGKRRTMILFGVLALGSTLWEAAAIQFELNGSTPESVSSGLGAGIYVMGVGAVLVLGASLAGSLGRQEKVAGAEA